MILLIAAAVLTCIIEAPIVYFYLPKQIRANLILNIVLINLITNLTLNTCSLIFYSWGFVIVAELIIPIIEAYMYRYCYPQINIKKLLFICYLANAASFGFGLCL